MDKIKLGFCESYATKDQSKLDFVIYQFSDNKKLL